VDLLIGWIAHRGAKLHGTFTHSLSALVVCTLLTIGIFGARWGFVTLVGYGSHLLVDLLDSRGPTNVTLGWPFSHALTHAIDPVLPRVPEESANGAGSLLQSVLQGDALRIMLLQTLIAALFFMGLLGVAWLVRRLRERITRPSAGFVGEVE
jgi:membrane-bound metal-dependent hydrolase YbcI (DUF457 family)